MTGLHGLVALCAAMAAAPITLAASPVDFGMEEVRAAIESRGLKLKIVPELSPALSEESFQILGAIVRGGSTRGLMYGLLAAAEQVRASGRLVSIKGEPKTSLRGVRRVMTATDWNRTEAQWLEFFTMLARSRFNRAHLILDEPLTKERMESFKLISRAAQERAVDIVVGLRDPQAVDVSTLLAACPNIRAVHTDPDSAAYVSGPISQAGRYVVLETSKPVHPAVPVPLRISTTAGNSTPICDSPCEYYQVYSSDAPVPASFAGLAGVELQGEIPKVWVDALYPVSAAPVRRAPARRRR